MDSGNDQGDGTGVLKGRCDTSLVDRFFSYLNIIVLLKNNNKSTPKRLINQRTIKAQAGLKRRSMKVLLARVHMKISQMIRSRYLLK